MIMLQNKQIDTPFIWKDRKGNYHDPVNMETRHLFMTLVMIWNHTMPEQYVFHKSGHWSHHRYTLGPFYSLDYLKQAVYAIADELNGREDLEPEWSFTLSRMQACFVNMQKLITLRGL
jgi:hypothetical protein